MYQSVRSVRITAARILRDFPSRDRQSLGIGSVSLTTLMLVAALGCRAGDQTTGPNDHGAVTLSVTPASVTLSPGDSVQLEATALDADGNAVFGYNVTWSTADSSVAAVDADGTVTGQNGGSTQITATAEKSGQSLSEPTNVSVDDGGTDGDVHPNEPSGMIQITDRDWSAEDQGWEHDPIGENSYIVSDADEPLETDGNVAEFLYPAGCGGGGSCANGTLKSFGSNYGTIYVHMSFKPSSNFQGHDSGVNKQFFLRINNPASGAGDHTFFNMDGVDQGSLDVEIQGQNHGCGVSNLSWDGGSITRGQWTELEFLFIANTPGTADGTLTVWQDGSQIISETSFCPLADSEGPGFTDFNVSLIWGGTGDTVAEDMWVRWGHTYISGKN